MRTLDLRTLATPEWRWAPAEPLLLPAELDGAEPGHNAVDQQRIIQLYAELQGGLPFFEVDWWTRLSHPSVRFVEHLARRGQDCIVVVHVQGPEQDYARIVAHPALQPFRHRVVRASQPIEEGDLAPLRALAQHARLMVRTHYEAMRAELPALTGEWSLIQPLLDAFDSPIAVLDTVDAWIALQLEPWVDRSPDLLRQQLFLQVIHQRLRTLAPELLVLLLGHITGRVGEARHLLKSEADAVERRLERVGLVIDGQPRRWASLLASVEVDAFEPSPAQLDPAWRDQVRRALAWIGPHRPGRTRIDRALRWWREGHLDRAEEELDALVTLQSSFSESDRADYLEACGHIHRAAGRVGDADQHAQIAERIRASVSPHWPPPGVRRHFSGFVGTLPGTSIAAEVEFYLSDEGDLLATFRAPRGWSARQFDLDLTGPAGETAHLRKCTCKRTDFSSNEPEVVVITATLIEARVTLRAGVPSHRYVAFTGHDEPFAGDLIRLEAPQPMELVGRSFLDLADEVGWLRIEGDSAAWSSTIRRIHLLLSFACGQWLKTPVEVDGDAQGPMSLHLAPFDPAGQSRQAVYPGEVGKLLRSGLVANPIEDIGRLVHVYALICQQKTLEPSMALAMLWFEHLKHHHAAHIAHYEQEGFRFLRPGSRKEAWAARDLFQQTLEHFRLGALPDTFMEVRNALIHELKLPGDFGPGIKLREQLIRLMQDFFRLQFGFTGLAWSLEKGWQPFQARDSQVG